MNFDITFIISGGDTDVLPEEVNPPGFLNVLDPCPGFWAAASRLFPEAIGARPCASIEGPDPSILGSERWRCCMGVTQGNGPRLTGGPRLRGWRSMRSKCPPSRSFHCSALLSCFVVRRRT